MTQEGFKRKLTSIFSADAVGYSRLMGDDEAATVRTLTSYLDVIASLIKQHNGIVIDSPGDNLLAEFASVVDAVQCAVAVQKELKARNDVLPENRKMQFRIGINLGDVIQEDDRIYGDGVNIAARLEGLAEPGGICISKTAFEHIESKLPYGYDYIGDQKVKNISKPVSAYRVMLDPRVTEAGRIKTKGSLSKQRKIIFVVGSSLFLLIFALLIWHFYLNRPAVEPASLNKMAYPLPDKPSIVVLPFNNMSDDPEQEYFSDGITEDLITDLSQISGIFVIGRNSTFTYKGKPFKFRQIAEDLGVRYVLEGSVRRNEDMVRINAQLIDTITGGYLWATRYDEKMGNLFSLQDKVTRKIVEVLAVKLTIDEMEAIPKRDTESLEAYLTFLKGWQQYQQFNPDAFSEAISLFEKAIEIDPNYGRAYAALAKIYMEANKRALWCEHLGITKDDCWFRRFKYMEMAMKSPNSLAHAVASGNYIATKNHNHSIAEAEIAVSLNPNDPEANYAMGNALCWAGRHKESVDFFRKAMRLDPFYKNKFGEGLGFAYFLMKRFKEAANWCKKSVDSNPENPVPLWYLIASYAHLGRQQEAEAALHELRKINPYYSNLWVVERHSHYGLKNSEDLELFLEGLSKAGMD